MSVNYLADALAGENISIVERYRYYQRPYLSYADIHWLDMAVP